MFQIFVLTLISTQLIFGAEINVSKLRQTVQNDFKASASADKHIAEYGEKLNSLDTKNFHILLPKYLMVFNKDFNIVANHVEKIIAVLQKYQNTNLKGNVFLPENVFNGIENSLNTLLTTFHNVVNYLQNYANVILDNQHVFEATVSGNLIIPHNIGSQVFQLQETIANEIKTLSTDCSTLQTELTDAATLLKTSFNNKGAKLFGQVAADFETGSDDFRKIGGHLEDLINSVAAIQTNKNGVVIISPKEFNQFFDSQVVAAGQNKGGKAKVRVGKQSASNSLSFSSL